MRAGEKLTEIKPNNKGREREREMKVKILTLLH